MHFLSRHYILGERSTSRHCRFIAENRDPISIKSKIWGGGGWRVEDRRYGLFGENFYLPYTGHRNRPP
jgi:hypothetical protein